MTPIELRRAITQRPPKRAYLGNSSLFADPAAFGLPRAPWGVRGQGSGLGPSDGNRYARLLAKETSWADCGEGRLGRNKGKCRRAKLQRKRAARLARLRALAGRC